jgi:hypothetical protein
MAKTKPKAKKKGKLKPAKRSAPTLKRKRSKGESTSRQINRGVTRTKKILRQPKKSIRSKPTPHKQRSTVEESTPSSLGPSTTVYESKEVTAFGSEIDENGTIATSIASSLDENNEKQDT